MRRLGGKAEAAPVTLPPAQMAGLARSPDVRRAVDRSVEIARSAGHPQVGPQHLLLALLTESPVVAGALASVGATERSLRREVEKSAKRERRLPDGALPLHPLTLEVLRVGAGEALLADVGLRPEHLLLSTILSGGVGAEILGGLGMDLTRAREILRPALGERYFRHFEGRSPYEYRGTPAVALAFALARATAEWRGRPDVQSDDVLFGILHVPESLGPRALTELGVSPQLLRERIRTTLPPTAADDRHSGRLRQVDPYLLLGAARLAGQEGRDPGMPGQISTEHLLMELWRSPGAARDHLVREGTDIPRIRAAAESLRDRVTEPDVPMRLQIPDLLSDWAEAAERGFWETPAASRDPEDCLAPGQCFGVGVPVDGA